MTEPSPLAGSISLYTRLLAYIKPLSHLLIFSIIGFSVFSLANVLFSKLIGYLIDTINLGSEITSQERLGIPLALILIVAGRGLGGFLGTYSMASLAFKIIHRLRCEIVERFLRLPVTYYDKNSAGHLISTVTFNVSQISAAVSDALAVMLREGLTIIGLVIWLLYLNWKLTLIFVAVTPFISAVVYYASTKFRKHSKRIQGSMGDVTQILSETLKGLKVIRIFGAEKQIGDRFTNTSALNTKQNLKLAITAAISAPVVQILVGAALALLLWIAMSPEALANTTSGDFVMYITAAGMLLKPVRQTSKINADIQKGLAAAATIFELLDTRAEHDLGTVQVDRVVGKVEFKDLTFAYQDEAAPVLKEINLSCQPGQTIAIVGHSGSGKSTLVNLLPRFYELGMGQILIDDVPHTDYQLQSLRHQIALVSQQVVLFNGTIRENIAYGELADINEDALLQALKNANALEFVDELPLGVDTMVGDDGLLLSGGQRQRLAIARALLKNAPILILDEATSALDSVSERYIQSALELLMQGRTTFVIAHRLSTIENADRIVVLDKGRIVESGSHAELLALGGAYTRLHRMQFTDVVEE